MGVCVGFVMCGVCVGVCVCETHIIHTRVLYKMTVRGSWVSIEHWRSDKDTGKPRHWDSKPSPVPLCLPHPKKIGMGSNMSLRAGVM